MSYSFSFLDKEHIPQIHKTFQTAFADYQVDMNYMTEDVLDLRMRKNAVDLESSIGVYENGDLKGFTLLGVDLWQGALYAFDALTGIVKDHRGKGLAREMFNYALPKLKKQGVSRFVLEVLQGNEPAVKAYRKSGFRIVRELDCFELILEKADFESKTGLTLKIQSADKEILPDFREFLDWEPSWENSFSAVGRIFDSVNTYSAFIRDEPVGLIVYCPHLNWIMSLVVKKPFRRKGIATRLMERCIRDLDSGLSQVKLLNVDHSDTGMRGFLERVGFKPSVRQFEMEMVL